MMFLLCSDCDRHSSIPHFGFRGVAAIVWGARMVPRGQGMNRSGRRRNRVHEMYDDELIAAVAAGDDTALRELFERHAPWVAARLRRTLPADAVEDVLQETFIAVWRGAASYAGSGAVGGWVWGIARRQAALWARLADRPLPQGTAVTTPDHAGDVADALALEQALGILGPEGHEQRRLVQLLLVEDRPVAEVAALLNIPRGTVKSRMFRARQLLRAALRGEGKDGDRQR
jgi:RNA polymerase sigma-70 factor, ECF subfamily